jgi:hypothetical protein
VGDSFSPGTVDDILLHDPTEPVSLTGQFLAGDGTAVAPSFSFISSPSHGLFYSPASSTHHFGLSVSASNILSFAGSGASNGVGIALRNNASLRWASDGNAFEGAGSDLFLRREAAGAIDIGRRGQRRAVDLELQSGLLDRRAKDARKLRREGRKTLEAEKERWMTVHTTLNKLWKTKPSLT